MSKCDDEITVLEEYIAQLVEQGILCEGTDSRPIYGERGKYDPLYVSVELTNSCNFRCSHCYKEAGIASDFLLMKPD